MCVCYLTMAAFDNLSGMFLRFFDSLISAFKKTHHKALLPISKATKSLIAIQKCGQARQELYSVLRLFSQMSSSVYRLFISCIVVECILTHAHSTTILCT